MALFGFNTKKKSFQYFILVKIKSKSNFFILFFFIFKFFYVQVVLVKSVIRVTRSRSFLGFIFPIQVSLGNEKSFGKRVRLWPVYQNVFPFSMIPESEKQDLKNSAFGYSYHVFTLN